MSWHGFRALISHWRASPWQLLTLLTGLAMATALWSGVQAINAEARASYATAQDTLGQGQAGQITRPGGAPMELAQYVRLRRAGWLVSPVLEGQLETAKGPIRLLGIEPLSLPTGEGAALAGPDQFTDFISARGVLIVHPEDADALRGLGPDLREDEGQQPGRAIADISGAQRLLDRPGEISRLLVADEQPLGRPELSEIDAGLVFETPRDQGDLDRLTDSFHLNLTAFGLLSFVVGIFIVYGAIGLAFEQRRPVFRTLRALGLPLSRLLILLTCELTALALVAGALGVGLGYVIAGALLPDVAATLRGLYGAEVTGQLSLRPSWWISGIGMSLLGSLIAASAAFWRLYRLPLLASSQPRAWTAQAAKRSRLQVIGAFVIGLVALIIGVLGEGLLAGFALLGGLLLASALALPFVLDRMLIWASRIGGSPVIDWFWADTRQQLQGLSLALMALLLAMATNIGVSTMVSSFRITFEQFLDQRLASELYVQAETAAQAAEIRDFAATRAQAVLPIISVDARIDAVPVEVYGVLDHPTYRDNWSFIASVPDVWDTVARGEGVLINEQLSYRAGLAVGDPVPDQDFGPVLGIFGDYGNPIGQVILGYDAFTARFPEATALRFGLRSDAPQELATELRAQFGLTGTGLINQDEIKAFSLSVFERTFSVTAALNLLTLSVAGIAILISLLTLATMRLPQLAPVWALGMTRRRLARLEIARALLLAAFTGLFAIPLGLGLAWVLLAIVNVEAFGWRLPMFLFPRDYVILGGFTMLAAFLAALWPAVQLARTAPTDLLKVFSNER